MFRSLLLPAVMVASFVIDLQQVYGFESRRVKRRTSSH